MCMECLVVFLEGVGIIFWLVFGMNEIGEVIFEKMKENCLIVWLYYGIYGVGKLMDEIFGLIEIVEKVVEVYIIVML